MITPTPMLSTLQKEMFEQSDTMIQMADMFAALASDCRIEIVYLLSRVDALPS